MSGGIPTVPGGIFRPGRVPAGWVTQSRPYSYCVPWDHPLKSYAGSPVRVLRVPHVHTQPMELICALLFRAALSPAADKGTGTTAMAAPQTPALAGERTVLVLMVYSEPS